MKLVVSRLRLAAKKWRQKDIAAVRVDEPLLRLILSNSIRHLTNCIRHVDTFFSSFSFQDFEWSVLG